MRIALTLILLFINFSSAIHSANIATIDELDKIAFKFTHYAYMKSVADPAVKLATDAGWESLDFYEDPLLPPPNSRWPIYAGTVSYNAKKQMLVIAYGKEGDNTLGKVITTDTTCSGFEKLRPVKLAGALPADKYFLQYPLDLGNYISAAKPLRPLINRIHLEKAFSPNFPLYEKAVLFFDRSKDELLDKIQELIGKNYEDILLICAGSWIQGSIATVAAYYFLDQNIPFSAVHLRTINAFPVGSPLFSNWMQARLKKGKAFYNESGRKQTQHYAFTGLSTVGDEIIVPEDPKIWQ